MLDIKLQLACLLICLIITIRYFRLSNYLDYKQPKIFVNLTIFANFELIFDSITAYTVNQLDKIPVWINYICHYLFYLGILGLVYYAVLYVTNNLDSDNTHKFNNKFLKTFNFLCLIGITGTMPMLRFEIGKFTNYSMGWPVWICFFCILVSVGMLIFFTIKNYHKINSYQRANTIITFCSMVIISFIQWLFPESLISSLFAVLIIISAYINQEDPLNVILQKEKLQMQEELKKINALLEKKEEEKEENLSQEDDSLDKQITLCGTTQESITLQIGNFIYAEALGNYITIYYLKQDEVIHKQLRQTMKQLEKDLENYSILRRVHRAFLVNLSMIDHVEGNSQGYKLILKIWGNEIPVSRSYISDFNQAINKI